MVGPGGFPFVYFHLPISSLLFVDQFLYYMNKSLFPFAPLAGLLNLCYAAYLPLNLKQGGRNINWGLVHFGFFSPCLSEVVRHFDLGTIFFL